MSETYHTMFSKRQEPFRVNVPKDIDLRTSLDVNARQIDVALTSVKKGGRRFLAALHLCLTLFVPEFGLNIQLKHGLNQTAQIDGPTILISPLLALMRNQIAAAQRMGVTAATINSDNYSDWTRIENRIRRNDIDILLISPERLANDRFRAQVLGRITSKISLLVIDEDHCISDWGHDFRPHYRLLERIVRSLATSLRLLATTATANNWVMDDLREVLGPRSDGQDDEAQSR